jgi:hypothetical protein
MHLCNFTERLHGFKEKIIDPSKINEKDRIFIASQINFFRERWSDFNKFILGRQDCPENNVKFKIY